jgi:hypothetical protein
MNLTNPFPTSESPLVWANALHKQFQTIAQEKEIEVIATFQTAKVVYDMFVSSIEKSRTEVCERCRSAMAAATARMHAILDSENNKVERNRMRKNFFRVTGDYSFFKFLPYW